MNQTKSNQKAYQTLASWISGGRFPHAVIVESDSLLQQKEFVQQAASFLLCSGSIPPCGNCSNCNKLKKEIHPDFLIYPLEEGSRTISVDFIRTLRQEAYIRPNEANSKIFLIQSADNMTVPAQNALLKILEEPPTNLYFFLCCTNQKQMLDTILSRCATVTLEQADLEECTEKLKKQFPEYSNQIVELAAYQTQGVFSQSVSLLEEDSSRQLLSDAVSILTHLLGGNEIEALGCFVLYERDRTLMEEVLQLLYYQTAKMLSGQHLPINTSKRHRELVQILDVLSRAQSDLNANLNLSLLSTFLCAKIRGILTDQPIPQEIR